MNRLYVRNAKLTEETTAQLLTDMKKAMGIDVTLEEAQQHLDNHDYMITIQTLEGTIYVPGLYGNETYVYDLHPYQSAGYVFRLCPDKYGWVYTSE